jgi:hypothetical protein
MDPRVAVVAIVRDERKFLDEWLVYHRLLGIDHFFVYDDEPDLSMGEFLRPHAAHVTVVPWFERHRSMYGRNKQTKAYTHALHNGLSPFDWVAYLDVDEFLVLKEHGDIHGFLSPIDRTVASVMLNWVVYGHNGFYDDPPGLVTASLTKRMGNPSVRHKSISRVADILQVTSAHHVGLKRGRRVGASGSDRGIEDRIVPGDVDVACVNHYQCRSFSRWMARAERGDAADDPIGLYPGNDWRWTTDGCLRQFVGVVATKHNEVVDESMLRYKLALEEGIVSIGRDGTPREPGSDPLPEGTE